MNYLQFVARHPRFLTFGFALAFFSSFGQTFFISLFGEEIRERFTLSHQEFGLCYSLATLASGLAIIWLGRKLDAVDLRLFTVALCSALVLACLGMAWAPTVLLLAFVLFMLRLTGQGLLSHTAMTSMARYFEAGRGKAMSIAGLGFPAGEAILPIAAVTIMAAIGWRQTWLLIAIVLGVIVVPLVLWLLVGHGDRHRRHLESLVDHPDDDAPNPTTGAARDLQDTPSRRRQFARRDVLRDLRFYLMLPAVMAPGFIVTGLFFHQVHLVKTKGWDPTWFAGCFAVFAGAQLPSALAAGPLVDRIGATRLLPLFLVPLATSLAVLAMSRHALAAPAFMALAGVTSGLASPIVGSMWAEVYGVRHLGAIRAMVTAILVFGTAGSPFGMGWLIDRGVTMESISWICCLYTGIGIVLAWVATRGGPAPSPALDVAVEPAV